MGSLHLSVLPVCLPAWIRPENLRCGATRHKALLCRLCETSYLPTSRCTSLEFMLDFGSRQVTRDTEKRATPAPLSINPSIHPSVLYATLYRPKCVEPWQSVSYIATPARLLPLRHARISGRLGCPHDPSAAPTGAVHVFCSAVWSCRLFLPCFVSQLRAARANAPSRANDRERPDGPSRCDGLTREGQCGLPSLRVSSSRIKRKG